MTTTPVTIRSLSRDGGRKQAPLSRLRGRRNVERIKALEPAHAGSVSDPRRAFIRGSADPPPPQGSGELSRRAAQGAAQPSLPCALFLTPPSGTGRPSGLVSRSCVPYYLLSCGFRVEVSSLDHSSVTMEDLLGVSGTLNVSKTFLFTLHQGSRDTGKDNSRNHRMSSPLDFP
jgi:hypothetical protein